MKTTTDKLNKLIELLDNESVVELEKALDKVLVEDEKPEVKLKLGWALGNSEDPANFLSLDFKIG